VEWSLENGAMDARQRSTRRGDLRSKELCGLSRWRELRNGEAYTGIVAFESADGWIVQTGAGITARVNSTDVISHQPSNVSVMPSGLLNGLSAQELADLYAYLQSLGAR